MASFSVRHQGHLHVRLGELRVGVAGRARAHRRHLGHPVVQHPQQGTELVRQVVDGRHPLQPGRPRLRAPGDVVGGVEGSAVGVLVLLLHVVVEVLTLGEGDLPQGAGPHQLPPGRHEAPVAGLLGEQVDQTAPLSGGDDAPAVFDGVRRRDLGADVLPRLQGLRGQRPLLGAAYRQQHRVHPPVCEDVLVPAVQRHALRPGQRGARPGVERGEPVAEGYHPVARGALQPSQPGQAPAPQPHHRRPNLVHVSLEAHLRVCAPCCPADCTRRADGTLHGPCPHPRGPPHERQR